jgi:hypothetical protein
VSLTVAVPEPLAEELEVEGLAFGSLEGRADPALIDAVVEVIGAVANLATVVVSIPILGELSRRVIRWARATRRHRNSSSPAQLKIVTDGDTPHIISLSNESDNATATKAAEELARILIAIAQRNE